MKDQKRWDEIRNASLQTVIGWDDSWAFFERFDLLDKCFFNVRSPRLGFVCSLHSWLRRLLPSTISELRA